MSHSPSNLSKVVRVFATLAAVVVVAAIGLGIAIIVLLKQGRGFGS